MRYRRGHGRLELTRHGKEQNPVPVLALLSFFFLFTPSTQLGNVELFGAAAGRFLFFLPPLGQKESQTKTPKKSSAKAGKKPLTFRCIHPIPGWI